MQIYPILIVEYNFLPSILFLFNLIFNVLIGNILGRFHHFNGSHRTPLPLCHKIEPKIIPKNCFLLIFWCCRFSLYHVVDVEILCLLQMQKFAQNIVVECRKNKKKVAESTNRLTPNSMHNLHTMLQFLLLTEHKSHLSQ